MASPTSRAGARMTTVEEGFWSERCGRRAAFAVSLGAVLLACEPARDIVASPSEEVCDGIDNDRNGIIDDVDRNGDGLCDCLRVGVLGYPGSFGSLDGIRSWLATRSAPAAVLAGQVLTPQMLAGLDVLVVQDVRDGETDGTVGQAGTGKGIGREFTTAEVQALKAWVDAGGGLMTLTGYSVISGESSNVNRLLAPFGLSYASQAILQGADSNPPAPVTHWDATHPIASGVTEVGVKGGHAVSGGTLVAWEPTQGAYDIGRAMESGRGHVFAWGDEWIEYDADWSAPAFQARRLWLNAFKWLTAAGYCQVPIPP